MPVVGAFPLMSDIKRRTIRAPLNEMDRCTVVSIYPKAIHEVKHTIQPGVFDIEPGSFEHPAVLTVTSSSWWKEIDDMQPLLEIPQSSIQIADSIVKDYCNGIFGCDMGENMPGLFYIPGAWASEQIKKSRLGDLLIAQRKQKSFFEILVKFADSLWAGSNGNPLSISEDMRIAARSLNLNNKDWLKDSFAVELVRCKACGHLGNPEFPVCSNCKAINDVEKATALGLQFAK
jgi:hypothetical protein